MNAKNVSSDRRRSRPVIKQSKVKKLKRNKPAMVLAIIIILMLIVSSLYVVFSNLGESDNTQEKGDVQDPDYLNALANTNYPVALLNTTKGLIAIELYNDKAPQTCQNFRNLVNDGFFDGMIFHRVMDDFMIQAGSTYPDGTQKQSPYDDIIFEGPVQGNDVLHLDGTISMASTAAGVGGSSQFFIMDGASPSLDGSYAAFGKTIYGIEVVRDIADEPHDGSSPAGGGKPTSGDIVINSIEMVKD